MRTLCPICTRLSIFVPAPTIGIVHDAPAIDRGVRANLDIIADEAASDMRNFFVGARAKNISKPIAADPRAAVHGHPRSPKRRAGIECDLWMKPRVAADLHAGANDTVRSDPRPVADLGPVADHGIRLDQVTPDQRMRAPAATIAVGWTPASRAGAR